MEGISQRATGIPLEGYILPFLAHCSHSVRAVASWSPRITTNDVAWVYKGVSLFGSHYLKVIDLIAERFYRSHGIAKDH